MMLIEGKMGNHTNVSILGTPCKRNAAELEVRIIHGREEK